jgi:prepilin-type N-terminal cleavage/methylation domain-containing protein
MLIFSGKKKGFTLIELLVVIFIIGLLASIGTSALVTARNRGKDARIQATLSQVRVEAALIKSETNSFSGLCDSNNTLNDANSNLHVIEDDVRKYVGNNPSCYANDDAYCVQSSLVTAGFYCLDSTGYAGTDATNCTAGNISCY